MYSFSSKDPNNERSPSSTEYGFYPSDGKKKLGDSFHLLLLDKIREHYEDMKDKISGLVDNM